MRKLFKFVWVLAPLFVLLFCGGTSVCAEQGAGEAKTKATTKAATGLVNAPSKTSAAKEVNKKPVFTGEQLKLKKIVEDLFLLSQKVNEPGQVGKSARKKITRAIDWTRVSQLCLGGKKSWSKQSRKNRKDFSRLLRDIISLTAYSRMDSFWKSTKYTVEKIEIKGKTASFVAKFYTDEDDYILEYTLVRAGKGWKLFDLSYEDIKYSDNIYEQINAFLKEKNFAVLLSKLRKRRTDLQQGKTKGKEA